MAKELTWRKAIEKVLTEASGAMHYADISKRIVEDGLRKNLGATPPSSVASTLVTAIQKEGEKCPFQKVGVGLYVLRNKPDIQSRKLESSQNQEETEEVQYDVISSFGMFWRRDAIQWASNPRLLGMQEIGAKPVDFNKQVGIYLLYDGREVIYVGRSTDRPMGRRLYEHTVDRLSTRWDRFSWFGMLPVSEQGELGKIPDSYNALKILPAIEAILIESLEPRQNRKRGDDLSSVEYVQKEDPEIQKKKILDSVSAALQR